MTYRTLITASGLAAHLGDETWAILDCRFDLGNPSAGEQAYGESHIPGAVYVHLDRDLSSTPVTDRGRHPLPAPDTLTERFSRLGIDRGVQVVAYDGGPGSYAARAWWMLRYMGHEAAAVLDGGWAAWTAAGLAVERTPVVRPRRAFSGAPRREWLITVEQVPGVPRLIDARDGARFRGETEPLDPVAGHIPGAVNHPFAGNLAPDGRFKDPAVLRREMERALGGVRAEDAVFYCGSGVTACHNLLALAHAGLGAGKLYAGSWSEWCRDPGRPIETGG